MYKYKTYRCEWQVQFGEIDQYGQNFKAYLTERFPTKELADEHLKIVAHQNPYNKVWIPNDAPHSYCEAIVRYKEVECKISVIL